MKRTPTKFATHQESISIKHSTEEELATPGFTVTKKKGRLQKMSQKTDIVTEKENLKNLLQWTPWDRRPLEHFNKEMIGRLKALENQFDECYVYPEKDKRGKTAYDYLYDRLENTNINPVYLIGFSGTGKTTFLNKSLNDICNSNNENAKQRAYHEIIDIIDDEYPVPRPPWDEWFSKLPKSEVLQCVVKSLSHKVYSRLFAVNTSVLDTQSRAVLQTIYNNYISYIFEPGIYNEFVDVFNLIRQILANNINYMYDTRDPAAYELSYKSSYVGQIYEAVFKSCIRNDSDREEKAIISLLRLLCILSVFSLDRDLINNGEYKYYLAFDNIEHFINKMVVLDDDVVEIIKSIKSFIIAMNAQTEVFGILYPNTKFAFSSRFRVILSMRETTSVIEEEISIDTQTYANIDNMIFVTTSFDLYHVIEKKLQFLDKNGLLPSLHVQSTTIRELLLDMLFDKVNEDYADRNRVANNLWDMLSTMFSFNKRRIIENLIESLYDKNGNLRQGELLSYKDLWSNAKNTTDDSLRYIYANAARQIVFRLIFDKICGNTSSNNFFGEMDVGNDTLIVRRVATFLGRHNPKKYVMFSKLLEELIISPHEEKCCLSEIPDKYQDELDTLSKVLFSMRSRDRAHHWCPLTIVKIQDDSEYRSTTAVYHTLSMICKGDLPEFDTSGLKYGIKISVAGRKFASFSSDYEYFAARYVGKSMPLFSNKNTTFLKNERKEEYLPVVETIRAVAKEALNSISDNVETDRRIATISSQLDYSSLYSKNLRLKDSGETKHLYRQYNYFTYEHSGREITHAERVIISHIGYIDRFRRYIVLKNHELLQQNNAGSWINNEMWCENELAQQINRLPSQVQPIAKAILEILSVIKVYVDRFVELSKLYSENTNTFYFSGKRDELAIYEKSTELLCNYKIVATNPFSLKEILIDRTNTRQNNRVQEEK